MKSSELDFNSRPLLRGGLFPFEKKYTLDVYGHCIRYPSDDLNFFSRTSLCFSDYCCQFDYRVLIRAKGYMQKPMGDSRTFEYLWGVGQGSMNSSIDSLVQMLRYKYIK